MYKDRGIIKWLPFDALATFRESIDIMLEKFYQVEKPILAIDQIEKINYLLIESYQYQKEIIVNYYQSGYFKTIYGMIQKVNNNDNYLIIANQKIRFDTIIDVNLT